MFQSTLRSVTCDDVQDGEKFIDAFYRERDAWLPSWDAFPQEGWAFGDAEFVGVDLVPRA